MSEDEAVLALGFMTGTSMDGLDGALLRTDGERIAEPLAHGGFEWSEGERDVLSAARRAGLERKGMGDLGELREEEKEATALLTTRHEDLAREVMRLGGVSAGEVSVVGMHGQTTMHDAAGGRTLQLGDGDELSRRLGITTAWDFRTADMAAGGSGAPLASGYHWARCGSLGLRGNTCVANVGGVSNVTWLDGGILEETRGFDAGPGNRLLDEWMYRRMGRRLDEGGETARRGRVDEGLLGKWKGASFFTEGWPKSVDAAAFDWALEELEEYGLSVEDGAATLTALTAWGVEAACRLCGEADRVLVSGGGRRNGMLMEMLGRGFDCEVMGAEEAGLDADYMEAEAFGWLAVRALRGKALTWRNLTGVREPTRGGRLSFI